MKPLTPLFVLATVPVALGVPEGFEIHEFAGPPNVEYPTAASAAANGDLYISSDKNGSLGHKPGFGKIVRATDTDGDGKADKFIDFVPDVSSPRGGHFSGGTLYLIHPPYLSAYTDRDGDGVAEEKKQLVKGFGWGIEHPRGADHTTNGVRMGIDGWLYVAVGDFGMPDAVGADGKHVTLHGGGVARVRPDGSELEVYAMNLRNICDTAISPYLDLFSRDNTNDGKGWNTRFHHITESLDHGYPRLYQHFADEAVKPLADYGGGSGTGGLYLHEPGFPKDFGDSVYTCDWTTGNVHRHPMKPFEASFVAEQETFQKLPRAIDMDVDGSSKIYLVDWRNGGYDYSANAKVGMIQQVTAPKETPNKYVDVSKATDAELSGLVASRSAVQRLEAQREILKRGKKPVFAEKVLGVAKDSKQPLYARVAAIFTLKQLYGKDSTKPLAALVSDDAVREFALRAMTDRLSELDGVPVQPYVTALKDPNPRVRLQALIGLGRLAKKETAPAVLTAAATWPTDESKLEKGAHYRLTLTAVKTLVKIGNVKACIDATANAGMRPIAIQALQEIHGKEVADALIQLADGAKDEAIRLAALGGLARVYNVEKKWDLNSWWNTRPDDRGPYYEPVAWEQTPAIKEAIERNFGRIGKDQQTALIDLFAKNRLPVSELKLSGLDPVVAALGVTNLDGPMLKVLLDACKDSKRAWEQRIECYRALDRAQADQKTAAKLAVLSVWVGESGAPASVNQLVTDFVNDPNRASEIPKLRDFAAKQSDAASRISWMSMLTLLNSPLSKPDVKKKIQDELDKNPREVGLFLAIRDMKLSGFDKQIENAINSDNAILISAAKSAKEVGAKGGAASGKKVGELTYADVFKAAMAGKGDAATGQRLFTSQGCIACHSVDPNAEQKGPYLGAAGAKFTKDYLVDSVLDPNKTVAQGFQTVMLTMKDGTVNMGFVTGEVDGVIEMRNIAGQVSKIKRADVQKDEHQTQSMMPPGLAAGLTVEEFTSLIEYLVSLKAVGG